MIAADPVFGVFDRMMRAETGQSLDPRRFVHAEAALQPVARSHGAVDLRELSRIVASGADHRIAAECVEALLNQETSFFRDAGVFDLIGQAVLPYLAERRAERRRLRIWSAGCAAGQEAYSLAIRAAATPALAGWTLAILGTDVSPRAIARARDGSYSQFEIQRGLPVRDMLRHFDKEGDRWVVRQPLRSHVRFRLARLPMRRGMMAQHDLILCRNLLLYLDPAARGELLDNLADWLAPDGVLILGASETNFGYCRRLVPSMRFRGCYRLAGAED